jgi:hypothetical protein
MSGTTLISSLAFPDFVDTVQRYHAIGDSLISDLDQVKSLYRAVDIAPNTGAQKIIDEYDEETYARLKIEGGDASKVRVIKGWSKTMVRRRFAAEIDITWEMRHDAKDQEIIRRMTNLSRFCTQRMALDLTHRFTFATSTSYTDMDGETVDTSMGYTVSTALVDSTHDLTGSTSTYSNVITGTPQFSKSAYQIARERANTQTFSNFNERRILNWDTVVTGDDPTTIDEVLTLKKSTSSPDQDNPGVVNNYMGSFNHIVLPRLATTATGAYDSTKTKWWFYMASKDWHGYVGVWESPNLKTPATGNNGEDIHNDNWTFGTRCSYGITVVVGRGVLGSCG